MYLIFVEKHEVPSFRILTMVIEYRLLSQLKRLKAIKYVFQYDADLLIFVRIVHNISSSHCANLRVTIACL